MKSIDVQYVQIAIRLGTNKEFILIKMEIQHVNAF